MGEPAIVLTVAAEAALARVAGDVARAWRDARLGPLAIGLKGDLGAGKTTWVRAMLRALGHAGRVPSPTYTLLEQYPLAGGPDGGLELVHMDLYRLADADELEFIGFRDLVGRPGTWLAIEWPERFAAVAALCDVVVELIPAGETARNIMIHKGTPAGRAALAAISELASK